MHWCENDYYFESLVPIGSGNYYKKGLTKDGEDGVEDVEDDEEDEDEDEDEEEEDDIEEEEEDSLLEEPAAKEAAIEGGKEVNFTLGSGFGGFQCNGSTAHLQCHV
ncbi:hypothetical protein MKW92_024176 [Papaver armeniacum]|nr:hypothetical protein MKW92_024176 [Papaver armeniacum]